MTLIQKPTVNVQMLIRRPAAEVYRAFVDPEITTKFWFTRSEGFLEEGVDNRWYWDQFGVSGGVRVFNLETNKRILIEWGDDSTKSIVEWIFERRADNTTLVKISNYDFKGSDDETVTQVIDSTNGFCLVLANAKAYLEHGILLNLINDQHPDA